MNNLSLHELADHFGTDKGFGVLNAHGYTRIYQNILHEARQKPLRILEVGLLHPLLHRKNGAKNQVFNIAPSLQMWAAYLPNALIAGFDIEDFSGLQHPRIKTWQVDQSNQEDLNSAASSAVKIFDGLFDLIIDDGSHSSGHQQTTLLALLPYLKHEGYYIIEDLHYQPESIEIPGIIKTKTLLKVLTRQCPGQSIRSVLNKDQLLWLQENIASVDFFDSLDRDRPNPYHSADALALIRRAII
jgi:hypothetical protein